MLDLEVWSEVREGKSIIRHSFYEKPITAPMVFHALGAHSWRTKIVTMSEEMRRNPLHMDEYHDQDEIWEIVRKFLQKRTDSGYNYKERSEVIQSTCKKYWRQKAQYMAGICSLYRSRDGME